MSQTASKEELQAILQNLDNIPEAHLQDLYKTLAEYEHIHKKESAEKNFMEFVKRVWPSFIGGSPSPENGPSV